MNRRADKDEVGSKVSSTFIVTSDCADAKSSFDLLVALGRLTSGLCMLICGESGVGKSTLVKWLMRDLGGRRGGEGKISPAIYVEIPTAPTAIAVFEALLTALGDPRPSKGTRPTKKRRVVKMLGEQQVRLIVLDDLQHIVDRSSDRILFDASEAIKEVLIDYPVSVLCAGLADSMRVIKSNEQLSRRYMATVHIKRFNWRSVRSRRSFVRVLGAFEHTLDSYDLPELQSEEVAYRFFIATGGIMDFVSKIFLFAATIAEARRSKVIGFEIFHEAWRRAFLHSECGDAPFANDFVIGENQEEQLKRALSINLPPPRQRLRKDKAKSRLQEIGL